MFVVVFPELDGGSAITFSNILYLWRSPIKTRTGLKDGFERRAVKCPP